MVMVNVLQASDNNVFDLLAFPNKDYSNRQYIEQQFVQPLSGLTMAGKNFINSAKGIYDDYVHSPSLKLAKAAIRAVNRTMRPNHISELRTLEEVRFAQPLMQRYIMANVPLREIYNKQMCDGYNDSYVDLEPGLSGNDHNDYTRVMDGIVVIEENKEYYDHFIRDPIGEPEEDLSMDEKVDILHTWDLVEMFITAGVDCTDILKS